VMLFADVASVRETLFFPINEVFDFSVTESDKK